MDAGRPRLRMNFLASCREMRVSNVRPTAVAVRKADYFSLINPASLLQFSEFLIADLRRRTSRVEQPNPIVDN